jgi:hypothetical protein
MRAALRRLPDLVDRAPADRPHLVRSGAPARRALVEDRQPRALRRGGTRASAAAPSGGRTRRTIAPSSLASASSGSSAIAPSATIPIVFPKRAANGPRSDSRSAESDAASAEAAFAGPSVRGGPARRSGSCAPRAPSGRRPRGSTRFPREGSRRPRRRRRRPGLDRVEQHGDATRVEAGGDPERAVRVLPHAGDVALEPRELAEDPLAGAEDGALRRSSAEPASSSASFSPGPGRRRGGTYAAQRARSGARRSTPPAARASRAPPRSAPRPPRPRPRDHRREGAHRLGRRLLPRPGFRVPGEHVDDPPGEGILRDRFREIRRVELVVLDAVRSAARRTARSSPRNPAIRSPRLQGCFSFQA